MVNERVNEREREDRERESKLGSKFIVIFNFFRGKIDDIYIN